MNIGNIPDIVTEELICFLSALSEQPQVPPAANKAQGFRDLTMRLINTSISLKRL